MYIELKSKSEVLGIEESFINYTEMALRSTGREDIDNLINYLRANDDYYCIDHDGKRVFRQGSLEIAISIFLLATNTETSDVPEDLWSSITIVAFVNRLFRRKKYEKKERGKLIIEEIEEKAGFCLTKDEKLIIDWQFSIHDYTDEERKQVEKARNENPLWVHLHKLLWQYTSKGISSEKVIYAISGRIEPPSNVLSSSRLPYYKPRPFLVVPDGTMMIGQRNVETEIRDIRKKSRDESLSLFIHFPYYRKDASEEEKDRKDKELRKCDGNGTKLARALYGYGSEVFDKSWMHTTSRTEKLQNLLDWMEFDYTDEEFYRIRSLFYKAAHNMD